MTYIILENYSIYGKKRVTKEISDVVWSTSFFNGVFHDELIKNRKSSLDFLFLKDKSDLFQNVLT